MQNSYTNILFDLDGTLTEPSLGITNAIMHALQSFGITVEDRAELYPFIGPPLKVSFMKYYSFSDEEAERAVEKYREYFGTVGLFENEVYFGIPEMLAALKAAGKHLYLATSKPTCYSERIMEHFGLAPYFDAMIGSNIDGTRVEKDEVIRHVLEEFKLSPTETVMVGDRLYDMQGAAKCNIDVIGVLYGYGSVEELKENGAGAIVEDVKALQEYLLR